MITDDSHSRDKLARYQSAKIQRPTFFFMWVSSLVAGGILALSSPIIGIMIALLFAGLAYVEYKENRVQLLLSKTDLKSFYVWGGRSILGAHGRRGCRPNTIRCHVLLVDGGQRNDTSSL